MRHSFSSLLFITLISGTHAFAQAPDLCDSEMWSEVTYCEANPLGVSDSDTAQALLKRIEAILSEGEVAERDPSDSQLSSEEQCMAFTTPMLGAALQRNPKAARDIISDITMAGGFAACRTDAEAVLQLLARSGLPK